MSGCRGVGAAHASRRSHPRRHAPRGITTPGPPEACLRPGCLQPRFPAAGRFQELRRRSCWRNTATWGRVTSGRAGVRTAPCAGSAGGCESPATPACAQGGWLAARSGPWSLVGAVSCLTLIPPNNLSLVRARRPGRVTSSPWERGFGWSFPRVEHRLERPRSSLKARGLQPDN